MMIAGSESAVNAVPAEATAFIGAVAAFVVLLMVFFLYINKKWCFYGLGGFPCCGELLRSGGKSGRDKNSGNSYSYSDPESSSDSEEDVVRRLQQTAHAAHAAHVAQAAQRVAEPGVDPGPSTSTAYYQHTTQAHIQVEPRCATSRSTTARTPADLASLAEKGKVNGGTSESSSCSTTSGDDDQALRHRDRKLHTLHAQPSDEERVQGLGHGQNGTHYGQREDNQDCIVVLPQEQLYDVTDLQSACSDQESQSTARCGHLEVAFAYDAPTRKMTVRVLQARDIPTKDRGGSNNSQVRLLLLPSKKQKLKTKIRQGDNPQFMESFLLHRVNPEDVNSMGVRLRLYGCTRMRRERLIGETVVGFSGINLELETTTWLPLEPRANMALNGSASDLLSLARSDSTGSTHSMQHGGVPELLLGLAFNATTGRLSVEVAKGSHFSRNLAMSRAPDTYVKLCLASSSGLEMARSKTSVRRGQPSPLFKETFMFQVALFQLPDVTLMVSVYSKRSMKRKEMIGWFSLGQNSSGEEELAHWNDMRDVHGEQVSRWHVLVEA